MNSATGRATDAAKHFAAIFESSEDAILSKDTDGVITSWNRAAERLYGWSAEEAIGRPISLIVPAHRSGEERDILSRALAGERLEHFETQRVTKDGRIVDIELSVSPIRDSRGAISGASVIARDVADRRRDRRRADRLQRITSALSKEVTPERALEVVLSEARAALEADAATVGLLSEDGSMVELAGSAGYTDEGLSGWERFPIEAEVPMSESIRTGESIFSASAEDLAARYPVLADAELRFASLVVVPLGVEGKSFGSLALSFTEPHEFSPEERTFMQAAAQQAAYTLDRARLYDAERSARQRVELLAQASELLSGSLDPETTLEQLAFLAVPRVADWCGVDLIDAAGDLQSVAVAHVDPEKVELARELRRRYPPDPEGETGATHVVRTGEPELYPEITEEMLLAGAQDERHLEIIRELGLASAMTVPLRARGRVLGALTLVTAESGRHYREPDLAFAEDLARHAALAVDNALLFRAEHEAALTLQRALLPESLPEIPGIELAARYLPAGAQAEVGGDWFDAIELGERRVAIVVGDVAGSGVKAASVMGQLRTALRAYVLEGHPPGRAVERLDRLMQGFGETTMATVVHATVDFGSRTVEYVRAGHPPPLVRSPDGEVAELSGRGSRPLGLFPDPRFHPSTESLPARSTILLYTDGLIERRDAGLGVGLRRLHDAFAAAPEAPAECVDAIVAALTGDEPEDDVAVLAMRI